MVIDSTYDFLLYNIKVAITINNNIPFSISYPFFNHQNNNSIEVAVTVDS